MTFDRYCALAQRTSNPNLTTREHLVNGALGLCGEAGEVADLIKKHKMQGHALDVQKILEEVGDVLWYCAEIATHMKLFASWDNIYQSVIDISTEADRLELLAVRLCSKAGTIAEKVVYSRPIHEDICEIMFICKTIAGNWGYHIIEVAENNIKKLQRRYPVKFDPERSINREV